MTLRTNWKIGDVIIAPSGTVRRITEVRSTGYTFEYPGAEGADFWSENSTDPEMGVLGGWELFTGNPVQLGLLENCHQETLAEYGEKAAPAYEKMLKSLGLEKAS